MDVLEEKIRMQASFAKKLNYADIPEEANVRARWVILDSLGCIVKGLQGRAIGLDTEDNILDIAVSMITTELYEGNRKAVGHPACHILPLMLAEAEKKEVKWEQFVQIFTAAYEVASRWGASVLFSHSVLGHGTVMTSGAVIAESLLQGISEEDIYEALLLAGSLPNVSVWQSVFDGSQLHDAYAGLAAITAKKAVRMQQQGMRSTGKIVNSVYADVMGAEIKPEKLTAELGEEYWLCSNYFKVHTGCRFVHPFADLLKEELEAGLKKEDVSEIHVYTYKKAARLTDQRVPNDLAAKFSIPVSLAVQLEKGSLTPDTIRNCQDDESVAKWEGHIWLNEDEEYNKLLPDVRGGRMEITLEDGSVLKREVFHAVGDFDNPQPYTEENLIAKFRENTKEYMSTKEQDKLIQNVLKVPIEENAGKSTVESMSEILSVFYKIIKKEN